jgi:hypothetical protein
MEKLSGLLPTRGFMARLATHVMIPWLVYISQCGLIVAAHLRSVQLKLIRLISQRGVTSHEDNRPYTTRIYLPSDSHHRYPRIHFHSVKTIILKSKHVLLLSAIPLLMFSVININAQQPTITIVPTSQMPPAPRNNRLNVVDTFSERWLFPTAILVKTIPIKRIEEREASIEVDTTRPLEGAPDRHIEVVQRAPKRARYAYSDICSRHHMRREVYNRGRSWRCRR